MVDGFQDAIAASAAKTIDHLPSTQT